MRSISAVLIIPAAHLTAINALGQGMGWGPSNYSVPLAADPEATEPTHFAGRVDVDEAFIAMTQAAQGGELPEMDFAALGASEADVLAAMSALIADFDTEGEFATPRAHAEALLAREGLVRVAVAA